MKKWKCPVIIVLLVLALVAVIARFTIVGKTVAAPDGRRAIALTSPERDLVLGEMRGFLGGIQMMTVAVTKKDMDTVAKTARALGMQSAQAVPATLAGKLPLEFKQLGFSVHQDFDQIAADAEAMGDPQHTMTQIGEMMSKCVACHAGHKLVVEQN
jgi:hypothetical protein